MALTMTDLRRAVLARDADRRNYSNGNSRALSAVERDDGRRARDVLVTTGAS